VKTIEHMMCMHRGETWGEALSRALTCLGVAASIPEENAIIDSARSGEPHWHRGHLLVGSES
jgi:hypothetical protein